MNLEELSDKDLIFTINNGHKEQGFEVLYRRWSEKILQFIYYKVGDMETAKDIRQDTFTKVYTNREKFNPKYKFANWLYKIAENNTIDYFRNRDQFTSFNEFVEKESLIKVRRPDEIVIKGEERKLVFDEINNLNPLYKEIILFYLKGMKYNEMSEVFNIPSSTLRWYVFLAKRKLKKKLSSVISI